MEEDKKSRGEALLNDGSQKTVFGIIGKIQIKKYQEISCGRGEEAQNEIERIIEIIKNTNDSLSYYDSLYYKLYRLLIMAFVS